MKRVCLRYALMRMELLAALVIGPALLFGNPQQAMIVEGHAHFEGLWTSELTIHTEGRAILEWDSFSIGSNETTCFKQGSPESAVLNRVVGDQPSALLGQLLSDGKVYLINPHGILVSQEAVIDVGSLIASSFDFSNETFLAGGANILFEGESKAPIVNAGTITAKNGDILLLGHSVTNTGSLIAEEGSVLLGSGHQILVGCEGKNFLYIRAEWPGDGIVNEGSITATQALLEVNATPYSFGLKNGGKIDALSMQREGGAIYLRCKGAQLENQGVVSASQIHIESENAPIENLGTLDAPRGEVSIRALSHASSLADQAPVSNRGKITGDTLTITAPKFESDGSIAVQKNLNCFVPGVHIETSRSSLLAGESVKVLAGRYFSSGTTSSFHGGPIEIEAEQMSIAAASLTTQGDIWLISTSLNIPLILNHHAVLKGRTVSLVSSMPVESGAQIEGELSVPSSLIKLSPFSFLIDPNPLQEPHLWVAFSAFQENEGRLELGQDWKIEAIPSFDGKASLELAANTCPRAAVELVDPNPTGVSSSFGNIIQTLSTGNVVVTKPNDNFSASNSGAVYLYNGVSGALISMLRGSQANDEIGSSRVTPLTNGNYVVVSIGWNNGAATAAGAVTWGSGILGVSGVVSATNSLVGTQAVDIIGNASLTALTNGNYVVASTAWSNGAATFAGAVTWGNGLGGTVGAVSAANSLVGTQASDLVGISHVTALTNGNYVVGSRFWANGALLGVGAVTWSNGLGGTVGAVSAANSLVGTQADDQVGVVVTALTNGNYVVASTGWTNGAEADSGAVTWGDGLGGTVGAVSIANSLVGTQAGDQVGGVVTALTNGNYVVGSRLWNNGAVADAGAVTWGNGLGGTVGAVSAVNSLVGTQASDQVGLFDVTALTNGNYVVSSRLWDNGAVSNAGAVTWGNGLGGTVGVVSAGNSLVGTQANDQVGNTSVIALTNGNYVVSSASWDNGAVLNAGAVTWGNGLGGTVGAVSAANSLVGTQANDQVGLSPSVVALTNGNYVVSSRLWNNGAVADVGAVTWGNGLGGTVGAVSAANSLVGTQTNDQVGNVSVIALTNGNYVVRSRMWDNGAVSDAGAVTWGNGLGGTVGAVSAANSLVGTQAGDSVGGDGLIVLPNSNYVVVSTSWDNGAVMDAGAVTWGNGLGGTVGPVSIANSLVGTQASDLDSISTILNLSSLEFIATLPNWDDGATSDAGAVLIASSETGTYCTGAFGAISSTNSLIGPNASAGLSTLTSSGIGSSSAGDRFAVVRFTNDQSQTRVFSIQGGAPLPSMINASDLPQGLHDFGVAISESFTFLDQLILSNGLLIFPPQGTIPVLLYTADLGGSTKVNIIYRKRFGRKSLPLDIALSFDRF